MVLVWRITDIRQFCQTFLPYTVLSLLSEAIDINGSKETIDIDLWKIRSRSVSVLTPVA